MRHQSSTTHARSDTAEHNTHLLEPFESIGGYVLRLDILEDLVADSVKHIREPRPLERLCVGHIYESLTAGFCTGIGRGIYRMAGRRSLSTGEREREMEMEVWYVELRCGFYMCKREGARGARTQHRAISE